MTEISKANPKLPPGYVPKFTEAEVMRRIVYLAGRCFTFTKAANDRYKRNDISFDPVVLINVCRSAMDDIWRYKAYHLHDPGKRSDSVKRAAYFTKWIVKLRPIFVARPLEAEKFGQQFAKDDKTLMLNEGFALHISLTSLATEANAPQITLEPKFMGDLLYDLRYRNMTEDALAAIYWMIRERTRKKDFVIL